jgi:predicted dehydrogenase
VRVLIAGLGAIGQRHARNLRAIDPGIELLAYRRRRLPHVVTETLQRDDSRDVEEDFDGIFADLGEALAARPDAVFVCTPSSRHLEVAQPAAEAGCHLFIEKPVSDTLEGMERLAATVAARNLVALVGCQWRFHPALRALHDRLGEGALGAPLRAAIEYREYLPDWHPYEDYRTSYAARADLGGGVVLTQIHDYDLAWWLLGPPRRVTASGGHVSDLDVDVEDTADAWLEGAACPVHVTQTFAARPPRRVVSLVFESTTIEVDLLRPIEGFTRNDMFVAEVRHFLDCVERGAAPAIPLADGIGVLEVALAVKQSMRTGQPVEIA